jgi:hypothetical protein
MDNLSASALSTLSGIANDDLVIMYDQTESGNIKLKKIEYSNFITGLATETYVDTAVSGVDADTVDGIEGNQFLRNDQSGSITGSLTVSGGTMNIPNGSIISKQLDVSSSQTNLDVSNCNSLDVNTSSGDVTISGLTGGVAGHILTLTKATLANNFIIEHNEGDGDQNIFTRDTTDITLSGYGGIILVCNGNHWFECGR